MVLQCVAVFGCKPVPCFSPLRAFQSQAGAPVSFLDSRFPGLSNLSLPCGRCIGCLLERSRQWAVRCMHEAQLHEVNCFITLTYEDDSVVSLQYKHFQDFLMRLRKHQPFRYFACGEYGEMWFRPHFHALLFGLDFSDKRLYSTRDGIRLYESPFLSKVWGRGFCTVGECTFQSAAYIARYCLKKLDRQVGVDMYRTAVDGVVVERELEMLHMSLKPGIGSGWIDKYFSGTYPRDYVVINGRKAKPPRFYDKRFKRRDQAAYEVMVDVRESRARERAADNVPARLKAKETVTYAAISQLPRVV